MTFENIADVLRIAAENGLSSWSFDSYRKEIADRESIALSLFYSGKLAGFVIARLIMSGTADNPSDDLEILNIAVGKTLQNKGLGQQLFDRLLEIAQSRGTSAIWLEVRKSNRKAIRFYEKNGFLEENERKNYYTNPIEDALIMVRRLTSKPFIEV